MFGPPRVARSLPHICKPVVPSCRRYHASNAAVKAIHRWNRRTRTIATLAAAGALTAGWNLYNGGHVLREAYAEEIVPEAELEYEKPRKKASSKEENRDIISSQHLQVKRSWENPGVYAWGSNAGRVVAPDSQEPYIKTPRRLTFFDGVLLRDMKLDKNFGAAIDEKGDLLQWGVGYAADSTKPATTLKGKKLISLAVSHDRVIALSSNGLVYAVPASREDQETGAKPNETGWFGVFNTTSPISYRKMIPKGLAYGEKIVSIAGGLEHVLLVTSRGRLFSAASAAEYFPSKGQLGIPGLIWATRPPGPFDQPHEVITLRGFQIAKIAAGDYHSLAADREGRVFSFGDNSFGQLGFDTPTEAPLVDVPSLLPIQKLYAGTGQTPKVTNVAAGGTNSYFNIDAIRTALPNEDGPSRARLGMVTADTWSCGQGITGTLGNGRWTHVQSTPTKIPSLSGLFEYDEANRRTVPIRLARFSVGTNHAAAVMDNVTHVNAGTYRSNSENDTNWGADIVFFGNNENYQLGTSKRNNCAAPVYIQPLDLMAERKVRGREEHRFQITPKTKVQINGRWVELEQRVECGRGVTAVYSGV